MKKYNIAQIGTFDVENYGDLLFTDVLEKELRKKTNNINKIYLFSPIGGVMPFYGKKVFPLSQLEKEIVDKNIEALIVGGGDLIRLDNKISPTYQKNYLPAINIWQIPILLAKKYNIPIIFNAPGVPFSFLPEQYNIINNLLSSVDYLSVRDIYSKEILSKTNIKNCNVVPDTINIISDVYDSKELKRIFEVLKSKKTIPNLKEYIVFQHKTINETDELYIEQIKQLLSYITEIDKKEILIVPIGYVHDDMRILQKLLINKKVHIVECKLHPKDMLSVFANSNGFIGTSLHGLVTTNTYGIPIMAINTEYLVKTRGYLNLIHKEEIEVNDLEEAIEIYKDKFKNQNWNFNANVKEQISEHFDKMINIIEKKDNIYNDSQKSYELILNELYSNIEKRVLLENDYSYLKNEFLKIINSKVWKINNKIYKLKRKKIKNKSEVVSTEKFAFDINKNKKIAIQAHIFYPALLDEIYYNLGCVPYNYDLYISTDTEEKVGEIKEFFDKNRLIKCQKIVIENFENKGRDIMPFILQLKKDIANYDYVCHIHTKRSKHSTYGSKWRKYLYFNLFGTTKNIKFIFNKLKGKTGIIFPDTYVEVKPLMRVGDSKIQLENLCSRLNIPLEYVNDEMVFPAGSMFWARTEAIKDLFEVVNSNDFQEETNQEDGTFAHAVERVFVILAKSRGYKYLNINNKTAR